MQLDIKELISNNEILKKIDIIAEQINSDFKDVSDASSPIYTICILKGAFFFYSELIRRIKLPITTNFITLSSYGDEFQSSGNVKILNDNIPDLNGKNVLIVEDLLDSGITLNYFSKYLKNKYSANVIKTAVLLNKKHNKKEEFNPDYCGFEIDDKFLVGFGMDYKGLYRNLDYIGYVELEK